MLFTIAERTTVSNHTAPQYIILISNGKQKINTGSASGFYSELLFLCTDYLLRHRIKENKADCSGKVLSGKVCH